MIVPPHCTETENASLTCFKHAIYAPPAKYSELASSPGATHRGGGRGLAKPPTDPPGASTDASISLISNNVTKNDLILR